jgi:hypothetical protein
MRASSLRRACAAGLAALTIGSSVAIAVSTARAQSEPPRVTTVDAGVLRLHLSNGGSSVSYSGPLSVPTSQPITISGSCGVTTSGSLLHLKPNGGTQGLGEVSNGLGVRTKNNCSTSSGQFGAGESLTVALGSAFGGNVRVDVAELDIEGKHNAELGVAVDGGPTATHELSNSSDNGPDSGVGDNDRVIIYDDFASLTLSAVGGEASLEGGGDGTFAQYLTAGAVGPIGRSIGTADTIFTLAQEFDHAVDCQESVDATLIGGAASSARFDRGLNDGATTPDDCEDIGVTFEILDAGVRLAKSTSGLETGAEQAVNARVDIVWAPQTAQVPLPPRQINFVFETDPLAFENVKWCGGFDSTGDVVHPPDNRFEGGVLPWCLISEDVKMLADGRVQQVHDGSGDPMWR